MDPPSLETGALTAGRCPRSYKRLTCQRARRQISTAEAATAMPPSRQVIASIGQVLGSLLGDGAGVLIYKHLGLRPQELTRGVLGYVEALESADPAAVNELLKEMVREASAIRSGAPTKYVFDGHWRELERWLLHDGWLIEDRQLVRVAPAVEEATGVRDALIEELAASQLDQDRGIRTRIEDAAQAFVREPPDFNASVTNVRIALETTARRAATFRSRHGGPPYPTDSWGAALAYLRNVGVLTLDEEQVLARVYTFISPGAHVPAGITEEEWARLFHTEEAHREPVKRLDLSGHRNATVRMTAGLAVTDKGAGP